VADKVAEVDEAPLNTPSEKVVDEEVDKNSHTDNNKDEETKVVDIELSVAPENKSPTKNSQPSEVNSESVQPSGKLILFC